MQVLRPLSLGPALPNQVLHFHKTPRGFRCTLKFGTQGCGGSSCQSSPLKVLSAGASSADLVSPTSDCASVFSSSRSGWETCPSPPHIWEF